MTDEIDTARRHFLTVATAVAGATGATIVAVPFVVSMEPSARAKALGAPVNVDVSKLEPGGMVKLVWRGKALLVVQRPKHVIDDLQKLVMLLRDPDSHQPQQPEYCKNFHRSIKPEIFVALGVCTHLGCVPGYKPEPSDNDPDLFPGWLGGFHCPCHGSNYDLAGRIFVGKPAPLNLMVPPHKYLSETVIRVGNEV